jgi:hypothetical protein
LKQFVSMVLFLTACSAPPAATPPAEPPHTPAQPPASATQTASATTPSTTTPATPSTPAAPRNITIERVEIANPLVIEGRARTFENHVALRARDANGRVFAEGYTTATGELGHYNPYRATLWLTRDPGARITVEALEHSAKDGSEQSLVRVERPFTVEMIDAVLYVPDANCTRVTPRTVRMPKSVSMARLLVEALMTMQGSPFPKGSAVNSVNLRAGTVTVDFNERLQNVGGACAAQMIRESVTQTLQRLPSVQNVVITAAGSEKLALQP